MMSPTILIGFKLFRSEFVSGLLSIFIGMLILTGDISAQYYPRKKFTIRDGLPQSQVLKVVQHPDGHVWLSTKGGIARFDGRVFESFGIEAGFHPDAYRQIQFVNDSTLFLGVQRHLAQWYLLNEDRYATLQLQIHNGAKANWRVITDMNGQLLFASTSPPDGSKNNPVYVIEDSVLVRSKNYEFLSGKVSGIQDWALDKIDSALWICDYNAHLYRVKEGRVEHMYQFKKIGKTIRVQFINGAQNEFLAFVPDENAVFKLEDRNVSVFKSLPQNMIMPEEAHKSSLVIDKFSNFFLLIKNKELWALFSGQNTWTYIDQFNWVTGLFVDDENNLYVPDEGALYVFNNFAFAHYTPDEDGIPKYVWSIVEDDQSRLWLGSYGHGLRIWDRRHGSTIDLTHTKTGVEGSNPLIYIYMGAKKAANGDMLIPGGQSVYVFDQNEQLKNKLYCDNAPALMLLEDTVLNQLYAGTTEGLYVFDEHYNQIAHYDDPILTKRPVVSMAKDQQGNLWLGTWEDIIRYDGQHFSHPFNDPEGPNVSAKCIQSDRKGNLWFGSHQGLFYYQGSQLKEVEDQLFKCTISFIIELDENRLLVGLSDGVAIIDPEKCLARESDWFRYYGEELGFTGIEPGQNGALRAIDGRIWIATTDQLTLLDPALLKPAAENNIRMQISSVRHFEHHSVDGEVTSMILDDENRKNREIPYSANRVRISFNAINHTSPNDVQYQYRLLGFNEEWSPPYNDRFAEYTNLKPGNYTFQVKAQHRSQPPPNQPTMAAFSFTIPTPFYLAWWFFVIVILSGGAAVSYTTVAIVRNRRMKREEEDLLKLEMCQLQYRALKAQVEPHFASNLLNSVNAAILKEDKLQASRVLSHFARLIRDILQHNDRMVYSLREELDFIKLYIDLERNVLKDKMQYVVQVDPEVNLDRKIPVMLLHTFVENSIKHAIRPNAEGGTIHLMLSSDRTGIHIQIADTGSGMQPDKAQIIGSGKGVSLVDRIVEIHNRRNKQKMTIQIKDGDSGRKVLIYIPESFIFGSPEPKVH